MSRSRRAEVLEEVDWLLSYRVIPEEIARRLGYQSAATLERTLHKYGEHELAKKIRQRQETYIACHRSATAA